MVIEIRRYKRSDIEQCIVSVQRFLEEDRGDASYTNHHKGLDFDELKLYNTLNDHVNDPDFFCNLIVVDEEIVGGLCAYIASPIYSSSRIAYDQIFYIRPKFTNFKAMIRLIKSYTDWAKERDVVECRLCSSTGFNQKGFTMLCKRLGFSQFEIGFVRRF